MLIFKYAIYNTYIYIHLLFESGATVLLRLSWRLLPSDSPLTMCIFCSSFVFVQVFNESCLNSLTLSTMSRFIFNLHSGEDFCYRCGRPANLFGSRDVETRWEGWCIVCNADWHYHKVVSSIRCCSRVSSAALPVVCGLRFSIPIAITLPTWSNMPRAGGLANFYFEP